MLSLISLIVKSSKCRLIFLFLPICGTLFDHLQWSIFQSTLHMSYYIFFKDLCTEYIPKKVWSLATNIHKQYGVYSCIWHNSLCYFKKLWKLFCSNFLKSVSMTIICQKMFLSDRQIFRDWAGAQNSLVLKCHSLFQ